MKKKWIKRLILSVPVMVLIYYLTLHHGSEPERINTVTSINKELARQPEISRETHHVIYALHESGYLVKAHGEKNLDVSTIESIFELLTVNAYQLPETVTSLIPASATLLDYELVAGGLTLNLSEAFLYYLPRVEQQLVSSLVWTYTELDEVNRVSFKIEGEPVNNLNGPLNVGRGLTRQMGINLELTSGRLNDAELLMLYFLTDDSAAGFLVPVTRLVAYYVDPVRYAVESLIRGPLGERYVSVFNHNTMLLEDPIIEDGLVTLNFSTDLYYDRAQTKVSSSMLRQLTMTLTEFTNVDRVSVVINGNIRVFDDQSNAITVPASRFGY